MDPNGVYLPDGAFSDFIGCPLEGDWTITVQDNQGVDDGYIFQWGIMFDASLYPDPETYQNSIVTENWTNDPTIVAGQNDTSIVIIPNQPGLHGYTYNVTDNFGCHYDTTVYLFTIPQPTILFDSIACYQHLNISGTTAFSGGVWTASDTTVHFNDPTILDPYVFVYVPGTYTLTFTDNACGTAVSADVYFPPLVYTQALDTVICVGSSYVINALQMPANETYLWSTGETGPSITINQPGNYWVTTSNVCHHHTDTATIGIKTCDILAPNIIVMSSTNGNNAFFVDYQGVKKFECTILNRWGNVIFEYTNPADKWDGSDQSGKQVEEGTYFYIIKAVMESDEELTKQGFVQVYR
jgi:hypothetical protein